MKNAVLTIALLIAIGAFALAFFKNQTADKAESDLNQERYSRMVAEEDLLKANEEAQKYKKELESLKVQLNNTEKLLKQSQASMSDLQDRLEKAESLKDSLENRMRESNKDSSTTGTTAAMGDI